MKAIKVEAIRRAKGEAEKEEKRASEAVKVGPMARTLGSLGGFLTRQDKVIAPFIMDMLP